MKYVTEQYETQLNNLAETLVTPERYSAAVQTVGQVALLEAGE